jgi:hypothetical protein
LSIQEGVIALPYFVHFQIRTDPLETGMYEPLQFCSLQGGKLSTAIEISIPDVSLIVLHWIILPLFAYLQNTNPTD